jgi:hypothetical protein
MRFGIFSVVDHYPAELPRTSARFYGERAGLTDFLAIMSFGGLAHERVLRSMESMARHVLPAFRA